MSTPAALALMGGFMFLLVAIGRLNDRTITAVPRTARLLSDRSTLAEWKREQRKVSRIFLWSGIVFLILSATLEIVDLFR